VELEVERSMARMLACGFLLASALSGCEGETIVKAEPLPSLTVAIPSAKVPVYAGPTATDLGLPREIAAAVEALAAHERIESSHVGAGGRPSRVYADYRALAAMVSEEQAVVLLRHGSPVVRGYMVSQVVGTTPQHAEAVVPLLEDTTRVETMSGCMVEELQLATFVASALCDVVDDPTATASRPAAQKLLESASKNAASPAQSSAAHCLDGLDRTP
jgi:hypothetical protein